MYFYGLGIRRYQFCIVAYIVYVLNNGISKDIRC